MKIQRFVLCMAFGLAAFGVGVGVLEIVRWLGGFSERIKVNVKTPVLTLPPLVEFKPAGYVEPVREPAADEESEHEWDGSGDYYISGKTPKGFEDFDSLSIGTSVLDETTARMVPVKPFGAINTLRQNEYGTQYRFSAINITGKRVVIVTRQLKGVSYQFDGKFVDEKITYKNAGGEYDDYIFLKGRLTKWKDGKKIAEAKVKFGMGGC